ncbi:MAG: hypothetical protein GY866_30755 [Proteobacteria bacterium]|nr:hypothetical protein [Pseudomonadota bacterium]
MTDICTLYGTPFSLYTGKARAYLIKQGIPFRESAPNTRHEALPRQGTAHGSPMDDTDPRAIQR